MKFIVLFLIFNLFCFFSYSQKLPELIPYRKANKWGYSNAEKKIIIPLKYDDAGVFYCGLAWVKKKNKYGFIDTKGNLIIPFKYTWVSDFDYSETATVQIKNEKYKIDKLGNIIAKKTYLQPTSDSKIIGDCINLQSLDKITDYILALPDISLALPNFPEEAKLFLPKDLLRNRTSKLLKRSTKKWATNNCFSNDTIFPTFDDIKELIGNFYLVNQYKHFGIINNKNKITVPIIYDNIIELHQNVYLAKQNYKWGIIDNKNEVIIPLIYDEIIELISNNFRVKQNQHIGIVNNKNQIMLPIIYEEIIKFYSYSSNGKHINLYWVKLNDHWGITDSQNNIVLPIIYNEIRLPIHEGYYTNSLYIIKLNEYYGYINITGQIAIPIKYVSTSEFRGQLARVEVSKNKFGYIDRKGVEYFEE